MDALEQLERRGSALTGFEDVEGYAAVLVDGKLEKEAIATQGSARLSARDLTTKVDDFAIVSGTKGSSITIGSYHQDNNHPGFLVLLYDPALHRVLYRLGFPTGRMRPRAWSDVAVRLR
jgi:hypothetical protein